MFGKNNVYISIEKKKEEKSIPKGIFLFIVSPIIVGVVVVTAISLYSAF